MLSVTCGMLQNVGIERASDYPLRPQRSEKISTKLEDYSRESKLSFRDVNKLSFFFCGLK